MTFKKPSRAGLVALLFTLLLGLFLSISAFTPSSYAEEATPAAASDMPPACAGNPDPKKAVLANCTRKSGETAWLLTSMAGVLLMTSRGLCIFYGGSGRKNKIGETVMTRFA